MTTDVVTDRHREGKRQMQYIHQASFGSKCDIWANKVMVEKYNILGLQAVIHI